MQEWYFIITLLLFACILRQAFDSLAWPKKRDLFPLIAVHNLFSCLLKTSKQKSVTIRA